MIVHYARVPINKEYVSSLDKLGIEFKYEYIDFMNIKSKERPQLKKMFREVQNGDTVYCESISRLGTNLKDIRNIIEKLVNKGVNVITVKEGINTENNTYKLFLALISEIDEIDREKKQENIIKGVEKCKTTGTTKTGKWFGREEKTVEDLPKEFFKYYRKMQNKEITKVEMSKLLGCGRATLYRWLKLYEEYIY